MSAEEKCTRFPCDYAYRHKAHEANPAGAHQLHVISADQCREEDDMGVLWTKWRVSSIAQDDGPWQVSLRVGETVMWVDDVEEAQRLTHGLNTALVRALEANLEGGASS